MSTLVLPSAAFGAAATVRPHAPRLAALRPLLKFSLVLALHAWLIASVMQATGLIAKTKMPLPLLTVTIAMPTQPATPPAPAPRRPPAIANAPVSAPVQAVHSETAPVAVAVPVASSIADSAVHNEPPARETPASAARYDADYLNNPAPAYPLISRRQGESGKVVLFVQVSAQGTAEQVEIRQSCGFPRLDEAALAAVRKWRFVPARRGDLAIAASVVVPLTFRLDS